MSIRHDDRRQPMHTAEVRIADDDDFGARLRDMSLWLDEHNFEPTTFTYRDLNPGTSVQVSFKIADEAEAFAKRFGGSLGAPSGFAATAPAQESARLPPD